MLSRRSNHTLKSASCVLVLINTSNFDQVSTVSFSDGGVPVGHSGRSDTASRRSKYMRIIDGETHTWTREALSRRENWCQIDGIRQKLEKWLQRIISRNTILIEMEHVHNLEKHLQRLHADAMSILIRKAPTQ